MIIAFDKLSNVLMLSSSNSFFVIALSNCSSFFPKSFSFSSIICFASSTFFLTITIAVLIFAESSSFTSVVISSLSLNSGNSRNSRNSRNLPIVSSASVILTSNSFTLLFIDFTLPLNASLYLIISFSISCPSVIILYIFVASSLARFTISFICFKFSRRILIISYWYWLVSGLLSSILA